MGILDVPGMTPGTLLTIPEHKKAVLGTLPSLALERFLPNNNDLGAALQAAHDAMPSNGGKIVVSRGDLTAITGATFTKPIEIIGQGTGSTSFRTNDPTLKIITTSNRIALRDIYGRYTGTSGAQNGCGLLLSTGGFSPFLFRVFADLFDTAAEFQGAWGLMGCVLPILGQQNVWYAHCQSVVP
jgi:hypothetical protein